MLRHRGTGVNGRPNDIARSADYVRVSSPARVDDMTEKQARALG
jgi:hypothetical protein